MEILEISIRSHDNKRNELFRACHFITEQTLQERGCKSSHFSQDGHDKNIIKLEQQWEDWSALNKYFRSDHFNALLGAMKWLGRTYEIRIDGGTQEEGRDAIERARGKF